MTESLDETYLRLALGRLASDVPAERIAERLAGRDYKPRTGRGRPIAAAGAGVACSVAAGVSLLVGLGASATPAFAGWEPEPTPPSSAGQVQTAEASCAPQLASSPLVASSNASPESWQPVITDTRGPYTSFILEGQNNEHGFCLAGPQSNETTSVPIGETTVSPGTARPSSSPGAPPAGTIRIEALDREETPAGDHFNLFAGRVAENVTEVSYHLADGTEVTASVADGWYLAWFPSTSTQSTVVETTGYTITTTDEGSKTFVDPSGPQE